MALGFRIRRHLVFLRHLLWEVYGERVIISIVATALFGSFIAIANRLTYPSLFWDQYKSGAQINMAFCELTNMHKLIRQPINTFTNFIYLIIAIFALTKGIEDKKRKRTYNLITVHPYYSFALFVIMIYTWLSSSFFHASLIDFAQRMDFSAVYSIALFPLMCLVHRVTLSLQGKSSNVQHKKVRTFMITLFTGIYLFLTFRLSFHYIHEVVAVLITLIILCGVFLEMREPGHANRDYLIVTGIAIVLAGVFFEMDARHLMCSSHCISPHSLWHLFNGLSIFCIYIYIRSERYDLAQDKVRTAIKHRAHLYMMRTMRRD